MAGYFDRQIKLMGEETLKGIRSKKVAIIGSGGLGCSLGIALAGSGVGELHLVDFDTVSLSNIHRQIAFKMEDIEKPKCKVLGELLLSRSEEGLKILSFEESLQEYASRGLEVDLIMDATDNLPSRAEIDKLAKERRIPWVYASVEEWHGQVCFMDKADFSAFRVSDRKPGGIATPIVMNIASLSANMALRFLAGLEVKRDCLHYCTLNEGYLKVFHYKMA